MRQTNVANPILQIPRSILCASALAAHQVCRLTILIHEKNQFISKNFGVVDDLKIANILILANSTPCYVNAGFLCRLKKMEILNLTDLNINHLNTLR